MEKTDTISFANIGIIVLNYNNGHRTLGCIESILVQSFQNFRIMVVDNGSLDDSVKVIIHFLFENHVEHTLVSQNESTEMGKFPEKKIMVIQAEKNGGYAAGNNIAIRIVRKTGIFTHVLILNNDTELSPDFLEKMILKYQTEKKKRGIDKIAIGSRETDQTGKIRNQGFHYLNIPSGLVFNFPFFPSFRYIVGSCIFLPASTPLMDDRYFLYYDDVAFSKILKKDHYFLTTLSSSCYKHETGSTTKKSPHLHLTIFRSMKIFYLKNYPLLFPLVVTLRFLLNLILCRPRIAADLLRISIYSNEYADS